MNWFFFFLNCAIEIELSHIQEVPRLFQDRRGSLWKLRSPPCRSDSGQECSGRDPWFRKRCSPLPKILCVF